MVVAIIAILASLILPALARARARAQGSFCLNNTRQLAVAWMVYADEHNGQLAYNLVSGVAAASTPNLPMDNNWANNVLNWELDPDNTNAAAMVASGLGPYTSKTASIYRCPSDHVLSPDQQSAGWSDRVRSYSMNAMVGDAGSFTRSGYNINNPDYLQFFKITAIPRPSDIFVFLDEHPDTIDDGYFINKAEEKAWRDLPASYHDGAASLSFADGHSEIHRWRYNSTKPPSRAYAANAPVQIPANELGDFYWIVSHMSVERGAGTSGTGYPGYSGYPGN